MQRAGASILVLNCGSSSIKFQVLNPVSKAVTVNGLVERLGSDQAQLRCSVQPVSGRETLRHEQSGCWNHDRALSLISGLVQHADFQAIGHRVVHGGSVFSSPVLIDDGVQQVIRQLSPLAPLHNPLNLLGIKAMQRLYPDKPQVAVFDTTFHSGMPEVSSRYAIPKKLYREFGVKRYGFHGISHAFVVRQVLERMKDLQADCVVSAHLGGGCSVAASRAGACLDTSMGFSPLEGLVMGQRSGDIDPTAVMYLAAKLNIPAESVLQMLNTQSGYLGLAGSSDSRDVERLALSGDPEAMLALDMFCYRLAKYIASYVVPLQAIHALVFTGGIGQNSSLTREKVLQLLRPLGFQCDPDRNRDHGDQSGGVITTPGSLPMAWVIRTNEELFIAEQTLAIIQNPIQK